MATPANLKQRQTFATGNIRAASTARPIKGAEVKLLSVEGNFIGSATSDDQGQWSSDLPAIPEIIEISANGFCSVKHKFDFERCERTRLIEDRPFCFLERISISPGQIARLYYHSPRSMSATLRCAYRDDTVVLLCAGNTQIPAQVGDVAPDCVSQGVDWPFVEIRAPDVPPGLYYIEYSDEAGLGGQIPLVINSLDDQRSNILAICSAATWICYNDWGGRNRYRDHENSGSEKARGHRPIWLSLLRAGFKFFLGSLDEFKRERLKHMIARLFGARDTFTLWPLSRNRPWVDEIGSHTPPSTPALNHLAAAEIKILGWLKNEGFSPDVISDLDLEDYGDILSDYDAIILLGHSEYWSPKMYDSLLSLHSNGGWLLNLSGNSIYREIEVSRSAIRMTRAVFGTGDRDETFLTGVRFAENAYGTAEPYRVVNADHWIWEGLAVQAGKTFGHDCLIQNTPGGNKPYHPERPTTPDGKLKGAGAAGFEVDRIAGQGRRLFTVVAEGERGRGAQMAVKEPDSGFGGSFTASSINFGGSLLVDEICAGVVKNVLVRSMRK